MSDTTSTLSGRSIALAKDKNDRFPSVSAFSTALEKSMSSELASKAPSDTTPRSRTVFDDQSGGLPPPEDVKLPTTFSRTAGEPGLGINCRTPTCGYLY